MRKLFPLLGLLLFCAIPQSVKAQCQTIISGRPRIYLNNAAYGSNATIAARLNAARIANTTEWQNVLNEASSYLSTEISAYFADSMAFEMAMMYNIDPTDYAAYGARALHYMVSAQQFLAPVTVITAATNANPAVFTTATTIPFSTGTYVAPLWGGTGNWAAANQASAYAVTVIDGNHFSVPLDSTSFGALTGNLTISAPDEFAELDQARWDMPSMAAAWDWAHPLISADLTTAQQTAIENVLVSASSYIAANPYEFPTGLGGVPYPTGGIGNLTTGPLSGALQTAVAFNGDVPGMQTLCSNLRTAFLQVAPAYTTGASGSSPNYVIYPFGHGGAFVESTEYAPEVSFFLMTYLETMLGATGENLYSQVGAANLIPAMMQFMYQDMSPGTASSGGSLGEPMPYGDIIYGNQHTSEWVNRQFVEQLAYYFCSTGDTNNCHYAEWWLQNLFTEAQLLAKGNGTVAPLLNRPNEFLWYDPTVTATNPQGSVYTTDYLADGYGLMLSRSAWTSSATWVLFKGGGLRGADEDHWHSDILGFNIYRNGDWLTNNMMFWDGPKLTRFNNVVLPETNQFGNSVYEGSNAPSAGISIFDWGTAGMTVQPGITQSEFNASVGYAYAESNATSDYRGQGNVNLSPAYTPIVNTAIRDFLYLKPDTYVIEDRFAYDSALTSEWNIQALASPTTPSGTNFTLPSLLGNNALNVRVLSPATPTYTVVSDLTQANELNGYGLNGCQNGAGTSCAHQWRIQMTSGNSVTSEQYFVVMQSGATGFTPLTVTKLTAANAIASQFTGYVVAGPTDTTQTGVTRSYTFTQVTGLRHIFMGLAPNTAYTVVQSGSLLTISGGGSGNVTTTSGGILTFTTPLGTNTPPAAPTKLGVLLMAKENQAVQ